VMASDSSAPHVVPLGGTGANIPVMGLSPDPLNFPPQMALSTSAAQTVTVSNAGNAPLQISSISVSGPFSQTNTCSAPVAVKGTCSISVTFTPTGWNTQTGEIAIVSNDAISPQYLALNGVGQDFTLGTAGSSLSYATVTPGQTATFNLSATPQNGFTGTENFTCTGAPSEATCTVNPASVNVSGTSSSAFTVTVTTTAASGAGFKPQRPAGPGDWLWMVGLVATAGAWLMVRRRFRWRFAWGSLIVVIAAMMLWAACGGGSVGGGGASNPPSNPGTPAGSYNLTVTGSVTSGSSILQHSMTLSLTVN